LPRKDLVAIAYFATTSICSNCARIVSKLV